MPQFSQIYEELHDLGAILIAEYRPLPCDTDAAVIEVNGRYGIFFDLTKINSLAKERAAASHEWAHIATGATYTVGATRAMIQRAELRASKAQIKKLLPFEELRAAIKDGRTELNELADLFDVPADLMQEAICYYTGPCGLKF